MTRATAVNHQQWHLPRLSITSVLPSHPHSYIQLQDVVSSTSASRVGHYGAIQMLYYYYIQCILGGCWSTDCHPLLILISLVPLFPSLSLSHTTDGLTCKLDLAVQVLYLRRSSEFEQIQAVRTRTHTHTGTGCTYVHTHSEHSSYSSSSTQLS